ncbi:MAG: TonB family protein [Verrucomicrobia bacterium]|nr:TonB family protein [Verrucomicrobiota bacterium]
MADYRSEVPEGGYKKNFVAITIIHFFLLGGLLVASRFQSKKNDTVVWMNPGSFGGDSTSAESQSVSVQEPETAPREEPPSEDRQQAQPEASQKEEAPQPSPPPILPTPSPFTQQPELPISTTSLTSTPSPTPTPRPTTEPTPKIIPKPTPRLTPRSTPKPTSKPTPKAIPEATAKPDRDHAATPKPSPKDQDELKGKAKVKQKENAQGEEKPKRETSPKPKPSQAESEKKAKSNASPETNVPQGVASKNNSRAAVAPGTHSRSGNGTGPGDTRSTGSVDSGLAAYVGILTNRFQAAWNQPTSEMALGKMLQVTVQLKVESDGTVTEFNIVEGSGNAVVDDSVREAGKKITKLPPPPNAQPFSAPVRFELGN